MWLDVVASARLVDVITVLSETFSRACPFAWAIPLASHWIQRVAGFLGKRWRLDWLLNVRDSSYVIVAIGCLLLASCRLAFLAVAKLAIRVHRLAFRR